jgi:hypothetical protein
MTMKSDAAAPAQSAPSAEQAAELIEALATLPVATDKDIEEFWDYCETMGIDGSQKITVGSRSERLDLIVTTHIAALRAEQESVFKTRAETAESALAAQREKTIQECVSICENESNWKLNGKQFGRELRALLTVAAQTPQVSNKKEKENG